MKYRVELSLPIKDYMDDPEGTNRRVDEAAELESDDSGAGLGQRDYGWYLDNKVDADALAERLGMAFPNAMFCDVVFAAYDEDDEDDDGRACTCHSGSYQGHDAAGVPCPVHGPEREELTRLRAEVERLTDEVKRLNNIIVKARSCFDYGSDLNRCVDNCIAMLGCAERVDAAEDRP